MKNLLFKLYKDIDKPIPGISLSLFRLVFSIILLIQTYYFLAHNFIEQNIIKPFILFPFIKGLNIDNPITIGYIMLIANIGMLYNKFARISTLIFFICFTYFWLLDKGYFNNHYYFISLICFLIFLTEKNASFTHNNHIPKISLLSLQVMVVIVYFVAGVNKLNPFWLFDLQPMKHILEYKSNLTQNPVFENQFIIILACYCGLFFDLFIGFILFWKKTRLFGFIIALIFHLGNYYLFYDVGEIGVFPFIMISTLILFINPEILNKIFKLTQKPKIQSHNTIFINAFIIFFLIIQLLIPFRHTLFKGHVDYTGIGQRFSWRMKIMYKEVDFKYFIINPQNNEKYAVNVEKMLTPKQYNNLKYFPDLIVPLAKKIKLEAAEKFNIQNAKVICEYKMGFMGQKQKLLFSPELDLSKIQTSTLTNQWLWPLKKSTNLDR